MPDAPTIAAAVVDRPPQTEEDRDQLLTLLVAQAVAAQVAEHVTVPCPCGRQVSLASCYRCAKCDLYLCPPCAARHLGPGCEAAEAWSPRG
jgi:hypothetical protein